MASGGGEGVVVTYTVKGQSPPVPTTVTATQPQPAAHQPLPLTGAPVTLELIGSFGLLVAGAVVALSAHRRASRLTSPRG